MKKLSTREVFLLMFLAVFGVGYIFYIYLWQPAVLAKDELAQEKSKVEFELTKHDVSKLQENLKSIESEKQKTKLKLNEIKDKRNFGAIEYEELLTKMGMKADEYKVDVIQFKRLPYETQNVYWQIPYEFTVQGSYDNIILFVNALYDLGKYFYITGLDLREVSRIPMSDKVQDGDAKLQESIEFEWASKFIEKLDKNIPSELKKEEKDKFMQDFADEMSNQTEKEEETSSSTISDKLQLKFSFHFISLEEPKE